MKKVKITEVSFWYKGACLGSVDNETYLILNKIAIKEKHFDSQNLKSKLEEICNLIDSGAIEILPIKSQQELLRDWCLSILLLLRNGYIKNNDQYGILKQHEKTNTHNVFSF
jgi:hypothetical protein